MIDGHFHEFYQKLYHMIKNTDSIHQNPMRNREIGDSQTLAEKYN